VPRYSVGIDFGTESVRVLVVDVRDGRVAGQAASPYDHGVLDDTLPTTGAKLPPDYALQHPLLVTRAAHDPRLAPSALDQRDRIHEKGLSQPRGLR